ncbi:MAG: hypothetical protein ACYCW6_27895 [Candidatus Xenobia bacterium]
MLCLECSYLNPRGATVCGRCRKPIANGTPPPHLQQVVAKLEKAARDVAMGQITLPEFEALLDAQKAVCEAQMAAVKGLDLDEETQAEMNEELTLGLTGIEAYLAALEKLRGYVKDRSLATLNDGVDAVKMANELLNQALQRNWQSYYAFKESMEEYLAQLGYNG